MAVVVSVSGKGGVGKTATLALLLDGLALSPYTGRVLVIDADPAMTLHLALGLEEPLATLAEVRNSLTDLKVEQLRTLPDGMGQYAIQQLQSLQALSRQRIRTLQFDMLSMGWGEGQPGCYCAINNTLSRAVESLVAHYDLVLVDNEAGMEHLSRHRIKHVDFFITVADGSEAARIVGERLLQVAKNVGLTVGEVVYIRILSPYDRNASDDWGLIVPYSDQVRQVVSTMPVVFLDSQHPIRAALQPLVNRLERASE